MHAEHLFHRAEYGQDTAQQLLRPSGLQLQVRSGVFLSGIRRVGKTTFLKQDLIPALEEMGALVLLLTCGQIAAKVRQLCFSRW
jgi:predicted AAA+ superfamily ATPase